LVLLGKLSILGGQFKKSQPLWTGNNVRQLSIKDNVEHIRRQSSAINVIT